MLSSELCFDTALEISEWNKVMKNLVWKRYSKNNFSCMYHITKQLFLLLIALKFYSYLSIKSTYRKLLSLCGLQLSHLQKKCLRINSVSALICMDRCCVPCSWLVGDNFFKGTTLHFSTKSSLYLFIGLEHKSLHKMAWKYLTWLQTSNSYTLVECYMFAMFQIILQVLDIHQWRRHTWGAYCPQGTCISMSQTVCIVWVSDICYNINKRASCDPKELGCTFLLGSKKTSLKGWHLVWNINSKKEPAMLRPGRNTVKYVILKKCKGIKRSCLTYFIYCLIAFHLPISSLCIYF